MKSIRSRMTVFTVFVIMISLITATITSIVMIRNLGKRDSEEMLLLLCETGEKNLDSYFVSVERSVETVAKYAQEDLNKTTDYGLEYHMERVASLFENAALNASGVLTYYYRIEPNISDSIDGFWYIKTENKGFVEHEVTDLGQYDLDNTNEIVWYTVPRKTGEAIWLPPYITENLGARVFSYNVPIYKGNKFFGVIGIEIDYSTIAEQINIIKLFENGYAFINDAEGNIIYHPKLDVPTLTDETKPKVPDGLLSKDKFIYYNYEGVDREAVWLTLSNGMRLNVTVPVSEINGNWELLLVIMIIISAVLLVLFIILTLIMTGYITKPITELLKGANQVNEGNYDVELKYNRDDEIGVLTKTFNKMVSNIKEYISKLSDKAYADALTSVNNKGAFDEKIQELQKQINEDENSEFAIAIFDCDNLKKINDKYGHKYGDVYIITACKHIASIFTNSQVYRIGGDEFAAILENEDYQNREKLLKDFKEEMVNKNKKVTNKWDEIHLSVGISIYDKKTDLRVKDIISRADELMYQDKSENKKNK